MERYTYRCGVNDEHVSVFRDFEMQEALQRLAYFEDLQEQGRLVELPCKIGTTAYSCRKMCDKMCHSLMDGKVDDCDGCRLRDGIEIINIQVTLKNIDGYNVDWFLTPEEAKAALTDK